MKGAPEKVDVDAWTDACMDGQHPSNGPADTGADLRRWTTQGFGGGGGGGGGVAEFQWPLQDKSRLGNVARRRV